MMKAHRMPITEPDDMAYEARLSRVESMYDTDTQSLERAAPGWSAWSLVGLGVLFFLVQVLAIYTAFRVGLAVIPAFIKSLWS